MKNGLLILVVVIQLAIALMTTGAVRSLAELAAFLVIAYITVQRRRSQPDSTFSAHYPD